MIQHGASNNLIRFDIRDSFGGNWNKNLRYRNYENVLDANATLDLV